MKINLSELQWMSRCLTHPDSKSDACIAASKAQDLFTRSPALISRYPYLYVMMTKKLAQSL